MAEYKQGTNKDIQVSKFDWNKPVAFFPPKASVLRERLAILDSKFDKAREALIEEIRFQEG